ncbi:MAG: folate-binding protein YgfZ [Bryobacterales bacterium]|nr:folate-binding protein YgfZ [Bryobacterales bacterium]
MPTDGYKALREGAALIDLTGRGWLRATGKDRVRLLHNLSSNHIKQLERGHGLYAFFLSVQGRIQADAFILCGEDALLLDTEPETAEPLFRHIKKYIIADAVTLTDETPETAVLGVEGPQAAAALEDAGATLPAEDFAWNQWEDRMVAKISSTGQPGFRVYLPRREKDALIARLGLVAATAEDARAVRLENGVPRYGDEFNAEHLPQETQRMHAVHFNKGCYLGQEIVERLRARGHTNWLLCHLEIDSPSLPDEGAAVLAGEKEVGEVASAVISPVTGRVQAFAWLRAEPVRTNAALTVAGSSAHVAQGGA